MPVPCARCGMPLLKWEMAPSDTAECPACGSENHVRLFPAALAQGATPRGEAALEGEAACFDHPGKRAVAACERCGRFVCQLCSIDLGAGVSCPSCVATPFRNNSRTLYDTWALAIPFGLMILWPLTILSAPAVVALAIMKWKQPLSLVRRNRWRFVVGLTVALVQGGLWIWFGVYLAAKSKAGA
jgi:hypothetical protein